jgi:hypothetical protein
MRSHLSTVARFTLVAVVMAVVWGGVGRLSIVSAQNNQATLTTRFSEAEPVVAGQTISIPFYLDTKGVSVDGIQVTGRFAGVPLSEVRLEMAGELKAQALSQQITNEGFTIMLSSADPSLPLVTNGDVLLFELTVVPAEAGDFKIEYDSDNTLVPSTADSTNILAAPSPVSISVGSESGAGSSTTSPQTASIFNAILALAVAGVIVALGVGYMKKQSRSKPTNASPTPMPPTQV